MNGVRKLLVMGLPGAGKTALAREIAILLGAVHWNADEVRANLNKDLKFTTADRIEQARRMGFLCDMTVRAGVWAIADFICPTADCRTAFALKGPFRLIWVDRIQVSRFDDTNRIFEPSEHWLVRIKAEPKLTPAAWAQIVRERLIS